jgi:CHRD domain-containing protein
MISPFSRTRMKSLAIFLLVYAVLCLVILSSVNENFVYAQAKKFKARLIGDNEIPPADTTAAGNAKLTFQGFKLKGDVITSRLNITGLTNLTGAHIYKGAIVDKGQPIVDLLTTGTQNKTKNGLIIKTEIKPTDFQGFMKGKTMKDLRMEMTNGTTYINIETGAYPEGEIRGQIKVSDTNATMSESNGTRVGNQLLNKSKS